MNLPSLHKKPLVWSSPGVAVKPLYCRNCCPYGSVSVGFCSDFVPEVAKLGILYAYPSKDDVVERTPWSGRGGEYWQKMLLDPAGLRRSDVVFSTVLRCRPPKIRGKRYDELYPTGDLKRRVEIACRHWDDSRGVEGAPVTGGLISFAPNLFIISFGLDKLMQVPAFLRLCQLDVQKAADFAKEGYRPLVLLGVEAMNLLAPWATGGVKSWRGHWWEGSWPFTTSETVSRTFAAAEWKKR